MSRKAALLVVGKPTLRTAQIRENHRFLSTERKTPESVRFVASLQATGAS